MEIPAYVPRTYHCEQCDDQHRVTIGNERDLARFRDKFIVKCNGFYIARWLSNHRVLVPIVPPVSVPVYRPRYQPRNALVALLNPPPAQRDIAGQREADLRPNPRRVTISLEMQNHHVTYRTADVLRNAFRTSLLDADSLDALHYNDIIPNSLQIREGQHYANVGDRSIPLSPQTSHISLRAKSRRFPFRYARDMADAFATFETYCRLHPDSSPAEAFTYAFPDLEWPGENAFFDAQLEWDTITPDLRRECANDRHTDEFLWDRVRGAAAEHKRLTLLRTSRDVVIKKEAGTTNRPLKRRRSSPALPYAIKQQRRGSSPIIIDDEDDDNVIVIDD